MAFVVDSTQRSVARINITPAGRRDAGAAGDLHGRRAGAVARDSRSTCRRPAPRTSPSPPPEPMRLRIDAAGGLSWNGDATALSALPALLASGSAARSPQPADAADRRRWRQRLRHRRQGAGRGERVQACRRSASCAATELARSHVRTGWRGSAGWWRPARRTALRRSGRGRSRLRARSAPREERARLAWLRSWPALTPEPGRLRARAVSAQAASAASASPAANASA